MDIKYLIEDKYMKYVLQINGFSGPRPRVGSGQGGATTLLFSHPWLSSLPLLHLMNDLLVLDNIDKLLDPFNI